MPICFALIVNGFGEVGEVWFFDEPGWERSRYFSPISEMESNRKILLLNVPIGLGHSGAVSLR